MLTHRGFSAWISCDGMELPEFKPECDDERNVVSCWIPSHNGQSFKVHWKDHGGYVDSSAYIYLDEHMVPGRFLFGFGETERGTMRVGTDAEVPFVFSAPPEEDEGDEKDANINVVKLKIKRVRRMESATANVYAAPPRPKKALKGTHRVVWGPQRPSSVQRPQTWTTQLYDPAEPVYVTFVFKYRPMDALEALGVVKGLSIEDLQEEESEVGEEEEEEEDDEATHLEAAAGQKRKQPLLTPSPSPGPSTKRFKTASRTPSYAIALPTLPELDTDLQAFSQESLSSTSTLPSFTFDSPISHAASLDSSQSSSSSQSGSSQQTSPNRKYYRY
ncbi:hypothetical protein EIP91_005173 [Steccherinum ochraceum]|uniref:DUF7918 domain-containing protein n=1 Tax=Steccherinum ochraceum TaxID=92696 RepID=A0A4R0R7W7_9APHY|nr:hypothetical protein EIP91_005173 [Steccherinum ochraceum]